MTSLVELVAETSRHLDQIELRLIRKPRDEQRDYDVASARMHIDAAQAKLCGILELAARRT